MRRSDNLQLQKNMPLKIKTGIVEQVNFSENKGRLPQSMDVANIEHAISYCF